MTYHEGELEVQRRAGVSESAAKIGHGIRDYIMPAAVEFLAEQTFAVIGGSDPAGMMWASPISGAPGMLEAVDPHILRVNALPVIGDPLRDVLATRTDVGLIAIDFAHRRRFRINGVAERDSDALMINVAQAYGNCPQYIQIRRRAALDAPRTPAAPRDFTQLTEQHREWIARADTFFIATRHPRAGADASHRGGMPGFVVVEAPDRIAFPDYAGNRMFNTLGNIAINPHAGLLFIDFESGSTLQISGRATIVWDRERVAKFPDAERVVELQIDRIVEVAGAIPLRWKLVAYSPSFE